MFLPDYLYYHPCIYKNSIQIHHHHTPGIMLDRFFLITRIPIVECLEVDDGISNKSKSRRE